ncbi:hypothetical protein ACJ6WD_39935 [Streptomyces sp. VTCC 41912]|uniref:hypothetical protein n=1 Tax=Streptomyces sp. VTCC 41912 TaxID=3383243 RepID=UPI003896CC67
MSDGQTSNETRDSEAGGIVQAGEVGAVNVHNAPVFNGDNAHVAYVAGDNHGTISNQPRER